MRYEKDLVGKHIATGGDYKVFQYGDEQVIKISTLAPLFGKVHQKKMRHDYELIKQYLDNYVVETTPIENAPSRQYFEIQPFIAGVPCTAKHARIPEIKSQLLEIKNAMQKLVDAGYAPVDLVGLSGLCNGHLTNIFVDSKNRLHIIDATLFEAESFALVRYLSRPLFWCAIWRPKKILDAFVEE
jgi:hypothetical protein